jgi:hypothetical protein
MTLTIQKEGSIKAAIKSIKTTGGTLQQKVHDTAIQCMLHAQEHGDTTLLSSLLDAVPAMVRNKGLHKWITDHSPLLISYDKKEQQYKVRKNKKDSANEWNIDTANSTPFWQYTQETTPTFFTFETLMKRMESIIAKAEAVEVEEGMTEEQVKEVAHIRATADKMKAIVAQEAAAA